MGRTLIFAREQIVNVQETISNDINVRKRQSLAGYIVLNPSVVMHLARRCNAMATAYPGHIELLAFYIKFCSAFNKRHTCTTILLMVDSLCIVQRGF